MEFPWSLPAVAAVVIVAVVVGGVAFFFAAGKLGGRRHEMSTAGLEKRVIKESETLRDLAVERESGRPEDDSVIKDHELRDRRVTLHDEETIEIYFKDHFSEVSELRDQLGKRGMRSGELDALYDSAENGADLRSISTALSEMSRSLRQRN